MQSIVGASVSEYMYILHEDAIVEHNKKCRPLQQNVHGTFCLNGIHVPCNSLNYGLSCYRLASACSRVSIPYNGCCLPRCCLVSAAPHSCVSCMALSAVLQPIASICSTV